VAFVSVSIVPRREMAESSAAAWGLGGTLAVTTGNLLAALGVTDVPAFALVSASGRIVGLAQGSIGERALERAVARRLLAPASDAP
jgi:hypothetical protein